MNPANLLFYLQFLLLFSCCQSTGQSSYRLQPDDIQPFEAFFINSNYSEAYSLRIVLTNERVKVIYKSGLVGERDTVLFSKELAPSDTLWPISKVDIRKLKEEYSNACVEDGLRLTVTFKKMAYEKTVRISNYYQEDIGKLIYLVNSIVPKKYATWYDKKELEKYNKICSQN